MQFLRKYYSQLIACILGVLVGFFIAITTRLNFEDKINPIAFASLLFTIIIALYLEFRVRPNLTNARNEKDLFIEQLKEIKGTAGTVQDLYDDISGHILTRDEKNKMLTKFRTLSNQISTLQDIIEYSRTKRTSNHCAQLLNAYLEYKRSLTGYGFDTVSFQYNDKYAFKHVQAYNSFVKEVYHFIVDVNKLAY